MSDDDNDEKPIYPEEGQAGPFQMRMYRGVRIDRLHDDYASDPGDYGRGQYWTNKREMAEMLYAKGGEVRDAIIRLDNALRLSPKEVSRYGREVYGFTRIEDGPEMRLAAAEKFTVEMKAAGYDGIITYGYEAPGEWAACVLV